MRFCLQSFLDKCGWFANVADDVGKPLYVHWRYEYLFQFNKYFSSGYFFAFVEFRQNIQTMICWWIVFQSSNRWIFSLLFMKINSILTCESRETERLNFPSIWKIRCAFCGAWRNSYSLWLFWLYYNSNYAQCFGKGRSIDHLVHSCGVFTTSYSSFENWILTKTNNSNFIIIYI